MPVIKLQRLRCSLEFYNNLDLFLEFLKDAGYSHFSERDEKWKDLREKLSERGVKEKFDFPDIKSTLRMLDIVENSKLSKFGKIVYLLKDNKEKLKQILAEKMLKEKKGWAYCLILKKLPYGTREQIAELYEETFDRESFQDELTDISKYNIFLKWLGVVNEAKGRYKLIDEKFNDYMGITTSEIELIDKKLKEPEKYCLMALIKLNSLKERSYAVKEIREFVLENFNYKINIHNQNSYGKNLKEMGYIDYDYSGGGKVKDHQRGEKGLWVLKLNNPVKQIIKRILEDTIKIDLDWGLINVYSMSFSEIAKRMNSKKDNERGAGLEQFASKICWILRLRNIKINYVEPGLELDVVAEQNHPFFSKFLIQCKNKNKPVSPRVLFQEVGVASTNKFDNIMVFSMDGFTTATRSVAERVMERTGINVFLFDGDDIKRIANKPEEELIKVIKRENINIKKVRNG